MCAAGFEFDGPKKCENSKATQIIWIISIVVLFKFLCSCCFIRMYVWCDECAQQQRRDESKTKTSGDARTRRRDMQVKIQIERIKKETRQFLLSMLAFNACGVCVFKHIFFYIFTFKLANAPVLLEPIRKCLLRHSFVFWSCLHWMFAASAVAAAAVAFGNPISFVLAQAASSKSILMI